MDTFICLIFVDEPLQLRKFENFGNPPPQKKKNKTKQKTKKKKKKNKLSSNFILGVVNLTD